MMTQTGLGRLTVPTSVAIIAFLAYGSQFLFYFVEPSPLGFQEAVLFNTLVVCIWISYARACATNVGWVPTGWSPNLEASNENSISQTRGRWCRKCEAAKPPRAHHCKTCAKCVPKMDHHCPWTASCVSHRTFPHFYRFLLYSVVTMSYLAYLLYVRGMVVWESRNLPSYLGPSLTQMVFLFILLAGNSLALFVISLLFIRNTWSLGANVTTIEGWEIERHELLVSRARKHGGYLDGPNGIRFKLEKQEFPFDVGIYQNIRQWMGTSPLFWLWPFAATPSNESGLSFEVNGFEDDSKSWPPPDPDRMHRKRVIDTQDPSFTSPDYDYIEAFRERQRKDHDRIERSSANPLRQRQTRYDSRENRVPHLPHHIKSDGLNDNSNIGSGWRDSEGERLEDFGVDEDVEFYDDDDVPLAELIKRRQSENGTAPRH